MSCGPEELALLLYSTELDKYLLLELYVDGTTSVPAPILVLGLLPEPL